MMEDIKVSVVVPNYNYARYLPIRLESILNQTFKNFELILLDDASTDNSVQVLEQYRNNSHVSQIVVNDKNTGSPFQQWMKGILLARGKYVWIAEADDVADCQFLETCVRLAEKEENTAACYVGSSLIDENGNVSNRDINHWKRGSEKKEYASFDGIQFAEHNLYWRNYLMNASGILFRREFAVNLAHSEFLSMRYCGDWLFWFQMAMQGKVIEVYRKLNYFRQHTQKVTVNSRVSGKGVAEDIRVVYYMESQLPALSIYKRRLRHGLLYRKVKWLSLGEESRNALYKLLSDLLHSDVSDYYLERRNQLFRLVCPFLLTWRRDRL